MKVGIIGGGIGGLTCAYRLLQEKIDSIVFEKEPIPGGRIPYAGAIATKKFQKRLISLIEEFDLDELKIPLNLEDILFLSERGEFLNLEDFQKEAGKDFSKDDLIQLQELNSFVNKLEFKIENPNRENIKLREISFAEYLKKYSSRLVKNMIKPMMAFSFEQNFELINADYGLSILRHANEFVSGKSYTFEGANLMTLTNIIFAKLKNEGVPVLTGTEVKKVEKKDDKFLILSNDRKEEIVDKIVFTLPLILIKDIFPELKISTNLTYKDTKCFFISGSLKKKKKFILGVSENRFNLRGLFNVTDYEQQIFPIDMKKEIDFAAIYEDFKISGEKELKPAIAVLPPFPQVPEIEAKIKNVYLCGDFYFYPWSETSVVTAEKIVDLIKKDKN